MTSAMPARRGSQIGSEEQEPAPRNGNRGWSALAGGLFVVLFAIAMACQWQGGQSVAVADGISYITAGVNLIQRGEFRNPFGEPELWFPPLYPILIGTLSLGGRIDPLTVARLISLCFALLTLCLVFRVGHEVGQRQASAGTIAVAVLAFNPVFQEAANAALSEATATALSFSAFVLWLRLSANEGPVRYVAIGALVGASYLTRPEAIILLPAWGAIDLCCRRHEVRLSRYVVAFAACAVVMCPYVLWLSAHTGRLTLTNKGEVNLASGRSGYYKAPREYIDPQMLEMGYYPYPVTASSEASRYLDNLAGIVTGFWRMHRGPLGASVLVAAILGGVTLLNHNHIRVLLGFASHFAYLLVLAWYAVGQQYLHATLPALAVLAAVGTGETIRALKLSPRVLSLRRVIATVFAGWLVVGVVEMGSRLPRWALTTANQPNTLLRDAGMRLKASEQRKGVVYELGATVGYYARQRRGRLSPNDLETVLRYIDRRENAGTPVWMALSSLHSEYYSPSLKSLMETHSTRFPAVVEINDERGRVVVYKVR